MEPADDKSLSAADRLERLSAQLGVLEDRIKADLPSSPGWFVEQVAELRAQTISALDDIRAFQPHRHSVSETEHDRHWLALKAATQTYRLVLNGGNHKT